LNKYPPIVHDLLIDALQNLEVVDKTNSFVRTIREILAQSVHDHDSILIDHITQSQIRSLPSGLTTLRDIRLARVAKFRVALAPHKKFPAEILSKIFLDACENRPLLLPPHARTRPWATSQVCARWRRVALNEPLMWNDLSIVTDRRIGERFSDRM
jgi:F-box-like